MNDQTSRDLLAAAGLIAKNCLCKGRLWDEYRNDTSGPHCVRGAIIAVVARRNELLFTGQEKARVVCAENRLREQLGLPAPLNGPYGTDLPDWNNAPERTQSDVVTALRAAAKPKTDISIFTDMLEPELVS